MLSKRALEQVENFKILSRVSQITDTSFEYSYRVYAKASSGRYEPADKKVRVVLIGRSRRAFDLLWELVKELEVTKQAYDPIELFKQRFPKLIDSLQRNVEVDASGGDDFADLIWLRQRY
jgi:hypothetical protein